MGDTKVKEWTVEFDDAGDPHTKCPHCGELDEISEVDTAIRWNSLVLSDDGKTASASTGSADFEGDGWICQACMSTELDAPDDFEIVEWY